MIIPQIKKEIKEGEPTIFRFFWPLILCISTVFGVFHLKTIEKTYSDMKIEYKKQSKFARIIHRKSYVLIIKKRHNIPHINLC
ncbi:MAG: hypothetical protein E7620_08810 [Ruminococcaceae bacterium]|nr:hypothetical protein [Oscillospiraceae bacterium]